MARAAARSRRGPVGGTFSSTRTSSDPRQEATIAITLRDVAELAGVSIKTVSEVVNRTGRVAPATTARVEEAVARLGYRPNLSARRLRSGRAGAIGLVVPELGTSGYFAELAELVVSQAARRGMAVLIEETEGVREREREALLGPRRSQLDGMLLNALRLTDDDLPDVPDGFPVVLLGERQVGGFDRVAFDNAAAARLATAHLLDAGARRILVVGGDPAVSDSATQRLAGHRAALEAAGRPAAGAMHVVTTQWDHESGLAAVARALAAGTDFDAVLGLNDALAIGAVRGLLDAGRRTPQDVLVAGIDGLHTTGFTTPRLTTVDARRPDIVARALALLLARIAGGDDAGGLVELEPALVVRESTTRTS